MTEQPKELTIADWGVVFHIARNSYREVDVKARGQNWNTTRRRICKFLEWLAYPHGRGVPSTGPWKTIDSAPDDKELIVGKWVNGEWRMCQSGHYYDPGNYLEGEDPYWYWGSDADWSGITEDEGPSHWMEIPGPLPIKPENENDAV